MEIYLVGGAVRDQLLNLSVKERDWVVVGATGQELITLGYRPVGKAFPVFLHPQTGEEYALARTEKKTGHGYYGFECYAARDVSLADDLKRRDLTINAIAQSAQGEIIDPYGGCKDLEARILRHVSPAFVEDPLRVLRLARFAARFYKLGFKVAQQTQLLIESMVASKELDHVVADRVWQETDRALAGENPEIFIQVLEQCGAWAVLFPQLKLQPKALQQFAQVNQHLNSAQSKFAALLLLLKVDLDELDAFGQRYPLPRVYYQLARLLIQCYQLFLQSAARTSSSILALFDKTDAYRRGERFNEFLTVSVSVACVQGDLDKPDHVNFLQGALASVTAVKAEDVIEEKMQGAEIKQAIQQAREGSLQQFLARFS